MIDRRQSARSVLFAKLRLSLILLLFAGLFIAFAQLVASHTLVAARERGLALDLVDIYLFGFAYGLIFFVLTTLPLVLVIAYKGMQSDVLASEAARELALLDIDASVIAVRWQDFSERNGLAAFALPMLLNLLFVYLAWVLTLFPRGLDGALDFLETGSSQRIGLAAMLPHLVSEASALSWTLLGVYFYVLSVLIRRWLQADLTTALVWWLDVRMGLGFLFGLLLMALEDTGALAGLGPWLSAFAFLAGILPDILLRWINRALRSSAASPESADGLVSGGNLRRLIPGMSFWQMDRLSEEGVSSVQDLASRDLAALLLQTRFDTPLLLSWVDRAILGDAAGADLCHFDRAGITSATQLLQLARRGPGVDAVLRSLEDAHGRWLTCTLSPDQAVGQPPGIGLTRAMLVNLLLRIEASPNVALIRAYMRNSRARITPRQTDNGPSNGAADTREGTQAATARILDADGAPSRSLSSLRHSPSRSPVGQRWLTAALLSALCGAYLWAAHAMGQRASALAARQADPLATADAYFFGVNYALAFLLLASLPTLMVLGYRAVKSGVIFADTRSFLERCRLDRDVIDMRMQGFNATQSLWAYLLAIVVNLALLYVTWNMALLPAGLTGLVGHLQQDGGAAQVSLSLVTLRAAQETTPLVWVMLGAYFYAVMALTSRWMRADLHPGVLWRINIRLAIAFVIGLLLMEVLAFAEQDPGALQPSVAAFAFACGIVPETALRLLVRRLRQLQVIDAGAGDAFAPSDLQARIPGMSFWEQDRLNEVDVDSVSDLAWTDLTGLVMRTRFDPALLMGWVDQALLCEHAGALVEPLRAGHLDTATLLVRVGAACGGREHILGVVRDTLGASGSPPGCALTDALLENLLTGLERPLNLHYLLAAQGDVSPIDLQPSSVGDAVQSRSALRPALPGGTAAPAALPDAQPVGAAATASASRILVLDADPGEVDFAQVQSLGCGGVFQCVDGTAATAGVALFAQPARRAGLLWGLRYRVTSVDPGPFDELLTTRLGPGGQTLLALEPGYPGDADIMQRLRRITRQWRQRSGTWPGLVVAPGAPPPSAADTDLAGCWLWLVDEQQADRSPGEEPAWAFRTPGTQDAGRPRVGGTDAASVAVFNGDAEAMYRFWTGNGQRRSS